MALVLVDVAGACNTVAYMPLVYTDWVLSVRQPMSVPQNTPYRPEHELLTSICSPPEMSSSSVKEL